MKNIKDWNRFNESENAEDVFKFLDKFPKLDKSFKYNQGKVKDDSGNDDEETGSLRICKACGHKYYHGFCPCGGYGEEEDILA